MDSKYNPTDIEAKWYQYWLDQKLFHSEPDGREPFTVVIPPPNVTGVLHMGHVLNETIQDILVRRARLEGKNACWVPGTDHASIATEAKVIKRLKEQGINKSDLTREEFLKHAWAWTDEHGGIILKQLRKLGCSCDWDRTSFTMDETRSRAVIRVFCDLYEKGLIYRGLRMVNWDPERQTALSDEEVIYHDEHSHLFHLKYRVVEPVDEASLTPEDVVHKDEQGYYAVVATTRPETIMGDVAMCINPKDPKNHWLRGKHVIVPLVGRQIHVIEDRYVEIEFGTGCLKVTPAHDVNDYALGQKYNLTAYDIFTPDAHINLDTLEEGIRENVAVYQGMDRFDCRKQIAQDLQGAGLMEKIEDYDNKVGYSERTNVPIEPRLSLQWFIRMQHFADIALPPVMNDEIVFYPTKYKNTYRNWLENIKDWCISRQLWWGHRIPAYYIKEILDQTGAENYPEDKIIVAPTMEEAQAKADGQTLVQDEGALDTWFSSWLWPISLFDGIEHPDNKEIHYYYPTADLVTGPDIIFFWVARMIMAGYEYQGRMPFRHVYFTGIVRDKLGRKMSKSLGNSPDPLDLIARFGADGVRMGMMLAAPAGNDILFDESLCEQGRNFCNKIWNCFRLIKGWEVSEEQGAKNQEQGLSTAGETPSSPVAENTFATRWFEAVLSQAEAEVADLFVKYRLSEALMAIYKLYTDEFSGWYLEMVKPAYGQPIDRGTYEATCRFLDRMLRLLHPFMPFITEELWQNLADRTEGESIMVAKEQGTKSQEPRQNSTDSKEVRSLGRTLYSENAETEVMNPCSLLLAPDSIAEGELVKALVSNIRNIRASKNISPKEVLTLVAPEAVNPLVCKLANVEVAVGAAKSAQSSSFIIGTTEYSIPLDKFINVDAEREKLEADLAHQRGFLAGVMKKLGNERFVQNAKPEVVALERKKQADAEARIATLEAALEALKK